MGEHDLFFVSRIRQAGREKNQRCQHHGEQAHQANIFQCAVGRRKGVCFCHFWSLFHDSYVGREWGGKKAGGRFFPDFAPIYFCRRRARFAAGLKKIL
jgi:hypothetical protein